MDAIKPSHTAFIALGSNVGERVQMIEKACLEMDRANIKVRRTSSLFETAPMYYLDQGPFMNGVCEVRPYSPHIVYACANPITGRDNIGTPGAARHPAID